MTFRSPSCCSPFVLDLGMVARMDTAGLVKTGAWKGRECASVYETAEPSLEARKAHLLPIRGRPTLRAVAASIRGQSGAT